MKPAPKKGELPFTPEEAELLIPVVRARIEIRAEERERKRREKMRELRRIAFSFNLFPKIREEESRDEDDAEHWRDYWDDAGDYLRLAMLEYAAGRIQ